jgi:hypothetical protein
LVQQNANITLLPREPYKAWKKADARSALDCAKARKILAKHQPRELDPTLERELDEYRQMVAARTLDEFYVYETPEKQDLSAL